MLDFKKPYEISLWDDRLTYVDDEGQEYEYTAPPGKNIITSYFKEIKLCAIGADSFNFPARAHEPKLVRNVNGSNTLTFSMYLKFYDEESETFISNPFISLLTNERKIKLKYQQKGTWKWLDFLIKEISEVSKDYKVTYTAKDLFVNELSKSGLNLVFEQELENNQGTVEELGARVLEGTDWQIGEDTEIIQQLKEEALYKIELNSNIFATNILTEEKVYIPAGNIIYGFYDSIANKNHDFFQFIYNRNGVYVSDDDRVIHDADSYYIKTEPFVSDEIVWPHFAKSVILSNDYRGERIVHIQKSVYDNVLEKYVKVYSDSNNKTVYGYTEAGYVTEQLVQSYITNGEEFISTSGWDQGEKANLKIEVVPSYSLLPTFTVDRISTLKYVQSENNFLLNTGFYNNSESIGEIMAGESFIFRFKAGLLDDTQTKLISLKNTFISLEVKTYLLDENGAFLEDDENTKILFKGKISSDNYDSEGYYFGIFNSKLSATKKDLLDNKYGIFISIENLDNKKDEIYYIQGAQFFRKYLDKNGNVCLPDGHSLNLDTLELEEKSLSYIDEKYFYYYPGAATKEEVQYLYIGPENTSFIPQYDFNFQKIRSITASKTNRFDLLQTLSETFECWCRFDVWHKETGEIMLGKDYRENQEIYAGLSTDNLSNFISAGTSASKEDIVIIPYQNYPDYQQLKFVTFHKNIGQINNVDIVYGINLENIQRTVESEEVISKLIVENNANEFAPYGSCSISRAKENPTGENFIYDFSYYINKGILPREITNEELSKYYMELKKINNQAQALIKEQTALQASYDIQNAEYQAIELQYNASVENLRDNEKYFNDLTSKSYDEIGEDDPWMKEKNARALSQIISELRLGNTNLKNKLDGAKATFDQINQNLHDVQYEINIITETKKNLISDFESKYYRFIQEGSWISEDYIDDELYYLDSESTLHNSSQPKVSYTIKVISIDSLEGYENYNYELGDITHVQDTEFFGWTYKNNIKTPYREKIVVTEIETNFDDPSKDTFKVQNYKTQFEDLFQRFAATSQKVELKTGAYDRAANLVQTDGNIAPKALEKAFTENAFQLTNIKNQSVTWDETGITTKNTEKPEEIVRVTSGGIYLTNDNGATWSTGITGQGINAKIITTGQLNTQVVSIFNGDSPSFRWDSLGINAFYKKDDGTYDNRTYVRFDQYGIYGIKGLSDTFTPESEESVWEKASFALTWKGFMLKSGDNNGSVQISSDKDFNVYDSKNRELIRIGRLDTEGAYGIRIKRNGAEVFRADQEGLQVGGWTVSNEGFYNYLDDTTNKKIGLYGAKLEEPYTIFEGILDSNGIDLSVTKNNWYMIAGNNFGVDTEGHLYANNATISGQIKVSTLGPWIVQDDGLLYKNEETEIKISAVGVTVGTKTKEWKDIVG